MYTENVENIRTQDAQFNPEQKYIKNYNYRNIFPPLLVTRCE